MVVSYVLSQIALKPELNKVFRELARPAQRESVQAEREEIAALLDAAPALVEAGSEIRR